MKLLDYIIFSLTVTTFIIGLYESVILGIGQAYWIFMLSLGLLFWYSYRKNKRERRN